MWQMTWRVCAESVLTHRCGLTTVLAQDLALAGANDKDFWVVRVAPDVGMDVQACENMTWHKGRNEGVKQGTRTCKYCYLV